MWNLKEKKEIKIPLLLGVAIFLLLYLPSMNRPFHFEELRITSHFYSAPSINHPNFSQDTITGNKLEAFWYDYIRLHPPGLVGFYYLWSTITFTEEEILMRIPLFLLAFSAYLCLFRFFKLFVKDEEAALVTLISSLFTFWYGLGSLVVPETFALFFTLISTTLFAESVKRNKVKKALLVVNFLGASISYLFLILIALQLIIFLCSKDLGRKKLSAILLASFLAINGVHYYLIPNKNHSNPLRFFMPKPEPLLSLKLVKMIFTGKAD